MKKVILIGDSIRKGYDKFVAQALRDSAEVYYPVENCRFTQYVLRNLHSWHEESGFGQEVDCIHWNAGLWDCLELFEDGPQTPLDVYELYIERICRRIRLLFPDTKVIFATSTPVWEEAYRNPQRSIRRNSTIEAYNAAAIRIVTKYGFAVNDLYELMRDIPKSYYSDMTHFNTKEAAQMLAGQVAGTIASSLGITTAEVDYDAFFAPKD